MCHVTRASHDTPWPSVSRLRLMTGTASHGSLGGNKNMAKNVLILYMTQDVLRMFEEIKLQGAYPLPAYNFCFNIILF